MDAALDHLAVSNASGSGSGGGGGGGGGGRSGYGGGVTLSGLLNTLDGVASTEERILFMTTNHIERLHPALIRPGRVDVREAIDHSSSYQIRSMFKRFYPDHPPELADTFAKAFQSTVKTPTSMAQLQAYLMLFKSNPDDAIKSLSSFPSL